MSAVYNLVPLFDLLHDWGTKLHRNGFKLQPDRKPLYEQVDIQLVVSRRDAAGNMLWLVFGTYGHRSLVSFQENRMHARDVMFFHVDTLVAQLNDSTNDLHHYARRLRYDAGVLVQSLIDAQHYKITAKP